MAATSPTGAEGSLRLFRIMAASGLSALFLGACGRDDGSAPQSGAPVVIVAPAESAAQLRTDLTLAGRIEAISQSQLAFQIDGRLINFRVREGDRVQAGAVLAEVESEDYRLRLQEITVVEQAARADLERRRQLQSEGILSAAAVEQAESSLASVTAERQSLERQVGYARLLAPYPGTVSRRLEEVGAVVGAGQPVLSMISQDALNVVVDVPAAQMLSLPLDERLRAIGQVMGIDEAVSMPLVYAEHAALPDEQSRTYRLVFRAQPLAEGRLLPGMAVRVVVPDHRAPATDDGERTVPASAIISWPNGESALWIATAENRARRVPVMIRELFDDQAVVVGDLDHETLVIVAGAHRLSDDQPIRPRRRGI